MMKKLLIIFLFLYAEIAFATAVIPMPEPADWLSKVLTKIYFCRYDLNCYFTSPKLGASITTIWATTTIASFPTIHNANMNALNNGKMENSTTSVQSITTLANLSTVGTITAGTWQANTLQSLYGGTGTTSMSKWRIVLGNGTASTTVATSTGASGQVLTSSGENANPSWVDLPPTNVGSNYAWTGQHSWTLPLNASSSITVANKVSISTSTPNQMVNFAVNGGALIGGTTTVSTLAIASSTLQANGLTYQLPSSQSINSGLATTSLLVNDGNGGLSWGLSISVGATTTNAGFTSTQVIAHGLGRVPALVEVKMVSTCDDNAGNQNEPVVSFGYATSTGAQYYIFQNIKADATSPVSLEGSGTGSIVFANLLSGTACISANLSDLNSTTFTINWGNNRGNTGNTTRRLLWRVQ